MNLGGTAGLDSLKVDSLLDPTALGAAAGPVTGNGSGYEGKMEFYSYNPITCPAERGVKLSPDQIIEKVGDKFYKTREGCEDIAPQEVAAEHITGSIPTPSIFTVGNSIFEDSKKANPHGYVYSICRAKELLPNGKVSFADGIIRLNTEKRDEYHHLPYTLFGEFNSVTPSFENPQEMIRRSFSAPMFYFVAKGAQFDYSFYAQKSVLTKEKKFNKINLRVNLFKPEYIFVKDGEEINGVIEIPKLDFKDRHLLKANCVKLLDYKF